MDVAQTDSFLQVLPLWSAKRFILVNPRPLASRRNYCPSAAKSLHSKKSNKKGKLFLCVHTYSRRSLWYVSNFAVGDEREVNCFALSWSSQRNSFNGNCLSFGKKNARNQITRLVTYCLLNVFAELIRRLFFTRGVVESSTFTAHVVFITRKN